jgi:hypothetical protein
VLLAGQLFEALSWTRKPSQSKSTRSVGGAATARAPDGDDFAMEYALVEVRGERLLARYVGPADHLAFNRSILRASLASLAATALIAESPQFPEPRWAASGAPPGDAVPFPADWILEPGGTSSCERLPAIQAGQTTSPPQDFTVTLRAGALAEAGLTAAAAAARCSSRRAAFGAASYAATTDWLGTSYTIEGVFIERGGRLLHLQFVAPSGKVPPAREVFTAWIKQIRP